VTLDTPDVSQSPGIAHNHCYAMVGHNPASSTPFTSLNPRDGELASPWCPGNRSYLGLFSVNAAQLKLLFSFVGAASAADDGRPARAPGKSGDGASLAPMQPTPPVRPSAAEQPVVTSPKWSERGNALNTGSWAGLVALVGPLQTVRDGNEGSVRPSVARHPLANLLTDSPLGVEPP
jgi:hypothetical protein